MQTESSIQFSPTHKLGSLIAVCNYVKLHNVEPTSIQRHDMAGLILVQRCVHSGFIHEAA